MKISVYLFNPIHQRSYVIVIVNAIVNSHLHRYPPLNSYENYFLADVYDIV